MVVFLMNPLTAWMVPSSETRRSNSVKVLYWHIILHVSTTKRRMEWTLKLLGDQVQVDLYLSMDHGVPNVFAVLKRGGCPSEIVMQYNK
jgi:hypothetical protein